MSEQRSFIVLPQRRGINVHFVGKAAELQAGLSGSALKI